MKKCMGRHIVILELVIVMLTSFIVRYGTIEAEASDIESGINFFYTGYTQNYVIPQNGYYMIEAFGGQGGNCGGGTIYQGGKGGYVKAKLYLSAGTVLYVNVGNMGTSGQYYAETNTSVIRLPSYHSTTFNGGGAGFGNSTGDGGGASDVRINGNSISNRFIVAGGGGGASIGIKGQDGGSVYSGNNGTLGQGSSALYIAGGGGGSGYYGGTPGVNNSKEACGGSNYFNASYGTLIINNSGNRLGAGQVSIKLCNNKSLVVNPNGGKYNGTESLTYYEAEKVTTSESKTFYYTGNVQQYNVPETGLYRVEVYGAQGGASNYNNIGGYGGYATGYVKLNKNQTIYITVGGQGAQTINGGYNGGGNGGYYGGSGDGSYAGGNYAGGGGGATHISFASGLLSDSNVRNNIIIAAGGGGGASTIYNGGAGGGTTGDEGQGFSNPAGTQTSGAGAGYGSSISGMNNGGGGAGWYGGYAATHTSSGGGSGGSGYLSSHIMYGSMSNGMQEGNGLATITHTSGLVTVEDPVRNGYTFKGWEKTGNGTLDNKLFTFGNGETILKAKWEKIGGYGTLVINPNGGIYNNTTSNTEYTQYYGNQINIETPYRYGYKFNGWEFSGTGTWNGSNMYTFGWETHGVLKAKWEIYKSNLTVDPNGGIYNNTTDKTTYSNKTFGSTQQVSNPTRTGYQFDYWEELYNSDGWLDNNGWHFNTKNAYLRAHWTANTYTLNIYQNKPSNASSNINRIITPSGYDWKTDHWSKTFTYDSTNIGYNPSQLFSLTGWIIDGTYYYSSNNGTGNKYTKDSNNITTKDQDIANIYVKWQPIEYDIVYDKNKPSNASHDVQGTTASSHHVYDTAKTLTPNGYSLVGWRFVGWNTKANGTGNSYSDKQSVKNLTTTNGGTVTLYAQWIQNTYTVNIYQNKPSNASHNINKVTASPSGYTWNTDHWSKTFTYDDTKIGYAPVSLFSLKGWTIDENNYYSANNGTGTTYNKDSSNLTQTHGGTVNLYVKWTANKYNLYYDKGLTTDTSTTTITDATRNTNIQKSGTDRPYTTATYDNDLTIAKIGGLIGRKYELNFNSNKPSSISKQKQNNSVNPTSVSKITGNLPSKGQWQISGQDLDVTANLTPAVGSKLTKPNYKDANNTSLVATALWNNKVLNNFSSPTLEGWKFVGWYDNKSGANSTPVSNTTDMVKTVNTTTNVSPNSSVTDTHNITAFTVQPKTTEFNQTLYARWQRTITLTFNMNGGQYQGDEADVILTGIYYNNADGYNFSLTSTPTAASLPNYEKQINQIDAYGTYDSNGENKKYTKYDTVTGITYRFLGWSTNKNATEPETKFIVFSSSKVQTLRLYDNTTLYAVWEPVLIASLEVNRTLGDLTFSDGTKPVNKSTPRRATDDVQTLGIIIKPGEQGSYTINSYGRTDRKAGVEFDSKIEDIYRNKGLWTDNLNPNTGTGEEYFESSGLTRIFNPATSHIMRKFYIPQYLGTSQSYASSIGVTVYWLEVAIWQDSYYYKYIAGEKGIEAVLYPVYVYIVTDKPSSTPTDPTKPTDPTTPPSSEEPVISVLDELRTKLKIRLH